MYLSDATLDDLLRRVLEKLLKTKNRVQTSRGETRELSGVLLRLTNPRARLSHTETKGKVFSCLGELLWYLAKTNDLRFISYYLKRYEKESEDRRTIYGAYGPRMFAMRRIDQVANVLALLREKPSSRRAVIQLFNAEDIAKTHREIPCTCSLQFLIRRGRLEMVTCMRSNDAFIGLPHDVFAFTLLQEIMARTLGFELGAYNHFVGSLHLYDDKTKDARRYLEEGWQPTESGAMPPMPRTDPWDAVYKLLKIESAIRRGRGADMRRWRLDPYWADLVRLLKIYRHWKNDDNEMIGRVRARMSSPVYDAYIAKKQTAKPTAPPLGQLDLPYPNASVDADGAIQA